jgi:hypothetical protein
MNIIRSCFMTEENLTVCCNSFINEKRGIFTLKKPPLSVNVVSTANNIHYDYWKILQA